jgi:6-pyruvoyl-tetrahydropterin synthase related domain
MTPADPPLAAQNRRRLPGWLVPAACCCAVTLLALIPFFLFGTASGHDFEFHAASWFDAAYQWKEGVLYPRWAGWMNHGFGEPRFIFYPPLSWMLGAALTLLLPDAAVPLFYIVLVQTLAGLAAYLLLRRLTSPRAATLGALFYTINPNALLIIYIRSDFAEQLACALFPLLLLATLHLCELLENPPPPSTPTVAAFAVIYAAVWLCNAPAGVIASYTAALVIAWAAVTQRSWIILVPASTALALGLGLTSFYLIPAAYEQRWVNINQALSSGLLPWQNFLYTPIADVEHTWFNWIASTCALILILLFSLAALFSQRFAPQPSHAGPAPKQNRPAFAALLLAGSAATLLMMRWTLPLWNLLPKLRFVQFPWRWMSIVALAAACFLAATAEKRRGQLAIAAILLLSIPLAWFLVRNTWWDTDEMPDMHNAVVSGSGFDGVDEYDPLADDHLDLPADAPEIQVLAADSAEEQPPENRITVEKWKTEDKRINIESAAPARIALRLLNYPAWQVQVNGKTVQPGRLEDLNQMVIPIAAGNSNITVRFTRTPDRQVGNTLSLLSALLAAFLTIRKKPKA